MSPTTLVVDLFSAVTGGSTAGYNYDPFGRLDTVTANPSGQILQRYSYDGFDRIAQHTKLNSSGTGTTTTRYSYDPLDRTSSKTDNAGAIDQLHLRPQLSCFGRGVAWVAHATTPASR